ncbi:MAG: hypothetical protein V5A39_00380 [Haloarculaceae archaeon]
MSLTRRQILGVLAAGSLGAVGSQGTAATFQDTERAGGRLVAGALDLQVAAWALSSADGFAFDLTNPDRVADGNRFTLPLEAMTDGEPQRTLLRFSLPQIATSVNNPASVWLRTECPTRTTLAEALTVRLSYSDVHGARGAEIASGSLRQVADALRTGERIDGDPSTVGDDCLSESVFVLVEYELGQYVGSETASLPLSVVGTQCRSADPDANPFPASTVDGECEPGYSCDCCWAIGKVEAEDGFRSGRTYAFDEGLAGYAIDVADTDGDSGVAFELVATDGGPVLPLCDVLVKGGTERERYPRIDGEYGFDTSALDGAIDGLVYAPENPSSGKRYAISHVVVSVCQPRLAGGGCPDDLVSTSRDDPRGNGNGGRKQ